MGCESMAEVISRMLKKPSFADTSLKSVEKIDCFEAANDGKKIPKGPASSVLSWQETNMGLDEFTTNGSHVVTEARDVGILPKAAPEEFMDSLNAAKDSSMDSLQEFQDSLTIKSQFYDSLKSRQQSAPPPSGQLPEKGPKKKLIMPSSISFNDSFSSDTSLFNTSQDASIDSIANANEEDEEDQDSLETAKNDSQDFNTPPSDAIINQNVYNSHLLPTEDNLKAKGPIGLGDVQPSTQSLVKLATEKMKRKFLGWS